MGELDEVAWRLRKQIGLVAEQRNELEDALYALWSNPLSEPARDEAARFLAVGPYDPLKTELHSRLASPMIKVMAAFSHGDQVGVTDVRGMWLALPI